MAKAVARSSLAGKGVLGSENMPCSFNAICVANWKSEVAEQTRSRSPSRSRSASAEASK
jgi:hypothetical protein